MESGFLIGSEVAHWWPSVTTCLGTKMLKNHGLSSSDASIFTQSPQFGFRF
jgi:hypothetical protein